MHCRRNEVVEQTVNLGATATHNSVPLSRATPGDSTMTGYWIMRRRPEHAETDLPTYVSDTGSAATIHAARSVVGSGSDARRGLGAVG